MLTTTPTERSTQSQSTRDAFAEFLLTRVAVNTRQSYLRDVDVLIRLCVVATPVIVPEQLAHAQLRRLLAGQHSRGLSGRSLARMLSSWRRYFTFLMQRGLCKVDPTAGLSPPKSPKRLPDALSPDEAVQLVSFVATDDDPMSIRD